MTKTSSRIFRLGVVQCSFTKQIEPNLKKLEDFVRQAADKKCDLVLLPELFESHYFCKEEHERFFSLASPVAENSSVKRFLPLAKELGIAIPVSFFESDGPHFYNSLLMIDAQGNPGPLYRKSHIPDGPGYEEKFYFRPGNTGFQVWPVGRSIVGAGICWDQWFPECARALALMGAEILLYPTAIGSEPQNPELNTKDMWQLAMTGHAISNQMPVAAANRIGNEDGQSFYGHSFIVDHRGRKLVELDSTTEGLIYADFDLDQIARDRASFGFFRDRRPELYENLID